MSIFGWFTKPARIIKAGQQLIEDTKDVYKEGKDIVIVGMEIREVLKQHEPALAKELDEFLTAHRKAKLALKRFRETF